MFECKKDCKAECCGIIPIPRSTYRKHKKKIPIYNIESIQYLKKEVLVITHSGYCAFLIEGKCSIYKNRPLVCKLYGIDPKLPCPYVRSDGTPRSSTEVQATQDKIHATVRIAVNRLSG